MSIQKKDEIDEVEMAMSLPQNQREAILRAIEYERNPSEQNESYVLEVMDTLFEIRKSLKKQTELQSQMDDIIKFAIRKNSEKDIVKQYFKVAPPIHKYKIDNPVEMLHRLLQVFEDPMDFSSCIEFNYKNLKDLMGDEFIKNNADIISENIYNSAVYFK